MIAYHATSQIEQVKKDGCVRPLRMPNVYLFSELSDADWYMGEFGHSAVVAVEYNRVDIASKWKPKYAKDGWVMKMKAGRTFSLVDAFLK